MRILLTNDDGIHSPGLLNLAKALERKHDVFVIAPDRERSAIGHAITIHHPLRVERILIPGLVSETYVLNGTPSDCVKLGLEVLYEDVDLVISGINRGPNLGSDVFYSGTVSAALEAGMKGLSAFAVSLDGENNFDFTFAIEFMTGFVSFWEDTIKETRLIFNINIPSLPGEKIKGIEFAKLGYRKYENIFEKREDPRGRVYYWQAGEVRDQLDDPETDLVTLKNGKISVTPLKIDLTHRVLLEQLKDREEDLKKYFRHKLPF